MEAKLRRVLEATFPGEDERYFLPMSIGSAPEHADEGAALILNGTKALTSSPFWDYPYGKVPFVGGVSVLLDGAQRPRGIVETTRVEIRPFTAITEEMARAYGEGEQTVEWWCRVKGGLLQGLSGAPQHSPHRRHLAHLGVVCRRASALTPQRAEVHSRADLLDGTKR
jgi:uncharacterized protein YhfF